MLPEHVPLFATVSASEHTLKKKILAAFLVVPVSRDYICTA